LPKQFARKKNQYKYAIPGHNIKVRKDTTAIHLLYSNKIHNQNEDISCIDDLNYTPNVA